MDGGFGGKKCIQEVLIHDLELLKNYHLKKCLGHLSGSVAEHLPLAQIMILGFWDRVPHQASRREPASPSACVSASLSVFLMNK